MERVRILLLTVGLLLCHYAEAKIVSLPERYDGTMRIYTLDNDFVQIPDSLTGFHIEYLGRHGARYLSSSKKVTRLKDILQQASAEGNLSPQGIAFLGLLNRIEKCNAGKWGLLTPIGEAEERYLAKAMAERYPFICEGRIEAIATYVPRVIASMYTFVYTLADISSEIEVTTSEGMQYSELLRYFYTDREYSEWLEGTDSAQDSWVEPLTRFGYEIIPVAPASALFKKTAKREDLQKISMMMYGVLQSMRAAGMEAPDTRWMSEVDYKRCWEYSNAEHYLKRSLSSISTLAVDAAKPLLLNIITNTEAAISGDGVAANLRFGHAETLLPLVALMGLPGCEAIPHNLSELSGVWKDYEISPLGANLCMVLAKNGEGEVYSTVLLNGKEVVNWQPWQQLKAYLLHRIFSL